MGLAAFPKQGSLQRIQILWNLVSWHYSDCFGSKELNSDRGTGVWQWPSVFSCWRSISRRLLDRIPSDISGFFSGWFVCVWMWLGRKYSLHCYIGEKQRKTSWKEQCKAEYVFLLTRYKSLAGQTSRVLNILSNQTTAAFCSRIQGFSVPFFSPALAEKRELCCIWKHVSYRLTGPTVGRGKRASCSL